jgi:hypothetical protein
MVPTDQRGNLEADPFSYRVAKSGDVFIERSGKTVTTLRGKAAAQFVTKLQSADEEAAQHLMARQTGNYKRGNER